MSIIGKWKTFWSSRPDSDFSHNTYVCEYTKTGQYIQEYPPFKGDDPVVVTLKCQYFDGKVRHFMKEGKIVDFDYSIDDDDILTVINPRGDIWKLGRVLNDKEGREKGQA